MDADVKGQAYESLLERNAQDVKTGAGQYFTPRPLIRAIVDVIRPGPDDALCDPACGTGGFLLAAHDYIVNRHPSMDRGQRERLQRDALHGWEIVDSAARLCAMNLYLHGIGGDETNITVDDSLRAHPGVNYDLVLTNPPFGRKSSLTFVNSEGESERESLTVERPDFWATTSNKQLNFLQHVRTLLKNTGRAAIVAPDQRAVRGRRGGDGAPPACWPSATSTPCCVCRRASSTPRASRPTCCSSTASRPARRLGPRSCGSTTCAPNRRFTLKTNPLTRADLDDFVACYNPENRNQREETERFRRFTYDELVKRDKANLDIFWLRDESMEDSASLPPPDEIAEEIVEDLRAALEQLEEIAADLSPSPITVED